MSSTRQVNLTDDDAKTVDAWKGIVTRAWSDPAFKARLTADPAAVLAENGVKTRPGTRYRVVEDNAEVKHLVIPPQPVSVSVQTEDRQPLSDFNPGF